VVRDRITQEYVVAAVFVAALFMSIMDSTVVNVAIPTLGRDFHAGNASIEWVVTAYLLSLAVWIPASGWVGDRFGSKRVFLIALLLFTAGSVLCGAAQSLGQLVAFRVLQGAGGGIMTPVGTAMLFRAFPPSRRARASQVLIVPTVLAPALGPIIGGLLIEHLSWRWVFYVNLPVGIAALVFGGLLLHEHREETAGRFDVPGFVLSAAGLALVLYAISEGPVQGWTSRSVVAAAVVGVASSALLVRFELRRPDPMLDLRLLGDRLFRTSNLVCLFAYAAFLGLLFVMPLFLQEARGASALSSGLTTFPEAVGVLLSSQLMVGRLYPKVGPRRLMTGGLVALTALTGSMALLTADTSLWVIRALMLLTGGAMAYVILPQQAATFATITPADTGRASAIYNTQRQTAAALGVAILATVLTTTSGSLESPRAADFHVVFLACAVLAVLGAAVAWTIRDSDAASTMAGGRAEPASAAVGH
jgi:EmrB/QacA subfamily drug resistance transporter